MADFATPCQLRLPLSLPEPPARVGSPDSRRILIATPAGPLRHYALNARGELDSDLSLALAYIQRRSAKTIRKYTPIMLQLAEGLFSRLPDGGTEKQYRAAFEGFLRDRYRCRVRQREHGEGKWVDGGESYSPATVRAVLACAKHYFGALIEAERMTGPNPLEREIACRGRRGYLHYNYYSVADDWTPNFVFDPQLAEKIWGALTAAGCPDWVAVVVDILSESGGRIEEVCRLTLADWAHYKYQRRCRAPSKGSRGRRCKDLCFSSATAARLKAYFDGPRRDKDLRHWDLDAYCARARAEGIDLRQVPLFLTLKGTPANADAFRKWWRTAARQFGISSTPHGLRHLYVTLTVQWINETAKTPHEREQMLASFIKYMHWKNGDEMLAYYTHVIGTTNAAAFGARIAQQRRRMPPGPGKPDELLRRVSGADPG